MPREMLGFSTFGLSMWLLRWLPIRAVDRVLLLLCRLVIGDTAHIGIPRPAIGPLQLKAINGKTPVLDVGTLEKIRSGDIKVRTLINFNVCATNTYMGKLYFTKVRLTNVHVYTMPACRCSRR